MTEQQILEGVRKVMREHLQITSPVELATDLTGDVQLDSLKQLTFVVELENHFRICFDTGEEEGLVTVGDVVELIGQRLAERSDV
jgi:acyl carrier protein